MLSQLWNLGGHLALASVSPSLPYHLVDLVEVNVEGLRKKRLDGTFYPLP